MVMGLCVKNYKFQFDREKIIVKEVELTESNAKQLIALSEDWEKENFCHDCFFI